MFRHFSEREALYRAMDARLQTEVARLLADDPPDVGLPARVEGLVRQRLVRFGRIAALKRAGNLQRWPSSFLQERHLRMQRLLREDLGRWLPEVDRAPAEVLEGIDLALSFEGWDRLRVDPGLSTRGVAAVLQQSVLALLGGGGRAADSMGMGAGGSPAAEHVGHDFR